MREVWTSVPLEEVCDRITDGTHYSPTNLPTGAYRYVTAKNIRPWGLDLTDISYVDEETHKGIYARCPVERGDVLYIKDGVTTGLAVVNPLSEPFSMLSSVALLKPNRDLLDSSYLKHWLNSPLTEDQIISEKTGTAIKRLVLRQIRAARILLPSIAYQRQIANKLDSLLTKIDAGQSRLDRVPQILKKFREAVLEAAVSGRLTEEWRTDIDTGGPTVSSAALTHYGERPLYTLPEGWYWARFSDVASIDSKLVDPAKYQNSPHIAPNHIESWTGRLLPYGTVRSDGVTSGKQLFHAGQVLYSKIRPYLAKAVITDFDGLCSADMYPLSGKLVTSRFLHRWLLTKTFTEFASANESRTVLPKINQLALSAIPVPVPPLLEQGEIVRRVDELFTLGDAIQLRYDEALARVVKLKPSVLAKAFRGELVPQDPNDEPAGEMLERLASLRSSDSLTRRETLGKRDRTGLTRMTRKKVKTNVITVAGEDISK